MSSEEADMKAKEAARNSARASKPGVVAVPSDEAARMDQRIAEKLDRSVATSAQSVDGDTAAKQRNSRFASTPSKPGAFAEPAPRSAETQLGALERDVAAKIRTSTGASNESLPGARTMMSNESVASKISRSTPGAQASTSSDPAATKVRREGQSGPSVHSELSNLENAITAKVRGEAGLSSGSVTNGARAQLETIEDSVAAKIRRETSPSGTPGAQARLQSIEDMVAAKIRRETNSSLSPSEYSIVDKVRGSQNVGARAELGNLEDSVAAKVQASNNGARAELDSLEDSVATKIRREMHSSENGAQAQLEGRHYMGSSKVAGERGSLVESDLNRLESDIRSKELNIQGTAIHGNDGSKMGFGVTSATDGADKVKGDVRPEQALSHDKEDDLPEGSPQQVATTADRGVVSSPDVEYGMMGAAPGEGLAIAVAIEEEEDDMFIPSAVEYDPDAKPPMYKNRRFRLYAFLAFFIIVVVVIGATIAATFGKGKASGTSAPTAAPTVARERLGIKSAIEQVVGSEVLDDPESPYAKALDWITFDDPLELTPYDSNFIQRYMATYLYYATTVDGPWRSCNPPENPRTDSSECIYKKLSFVFPEMYDDTPWHSWLSKKGECDWAGVLCDKQGQVRSIDLSGGLLSGTFPEGVYKFPFLQDLSLYWNNLTGALPEQLVEMDHLISIELHFNKFTGSVPDAWWQARNLQRMNLGENLLTGSIPKEVANLRDMKGFFFMTNMFTGTIPEEIGVLDSVTYFRASRNQLEGPLPSTFTNLKNVVEVWLHRNILNGTIPEAISDLKLLADLRLHVNPMSGGLPESLWDLEEVYRLDLYECNFTGTLSPNISKLGDGLYELHLSDNLMTGPIPQNISLNTELYSVWLQGNAFTGAIPQELCNLKGDAQKEILTEFQADCSPDSEGFVELECPAGCCTICCKPDGSDCLPTESEV